MMEDLRPAEDRRALLACRSSQSFSEEHYYRTPNTGAPAHLTPTPDISVVIPVYNGAGVLPRALSSVLAQTLAPAEIIVVDDGSTDGSATVAHRFGNLVRVISQQNAGVSSARNRGVAECGSKLVAFLDADDEWMPGFLATISNLVVTYPDCGMYCTAYSRRFANGSDVPCLIRGLPGSAPQWSGVLPDYFRIAAMSDPPACACATVVRRDSLLTVGGFPAGVTSGEDLVTWAQMAARQPVAFASAPLSMFWQPVGATPNVVSRPTRKPQTPDQVGYILRQLLRTVPAAQRRSLREYIASWHKMRASCYMRLGRPGSATAELGRAVCAAPFSGTLYLGVVRSLFRAVFGLRRATMHGGLT